MADRIESWYFETPPITRTYATASFIISLLCQLRMLSPFHLHFSWELIFYGRQYWRLMTNFFFFGTFGLDFLFHMFYLTRYCRMLEEGSFRGRPADFLYMLFLGAVSITLIAPFLPRYSLPFLGSPLTFMMVYIWARRNPFIHLNYLGLFVFQAPYLPWVLLSFSLLLSHGWPTGDLVGIAVGHVYWFLEDVYPRMLDSQGNRRGKVLKTPWFL
ncbi:Derlin [Paraphysoderma sedebokerense]|nr:Derlin [Paraphysoderma sedebokerense]